jgi:serine/threonine protein kinase
VLGGGSLAETFLAHNTTSGEPLAIKLYRLPRQRQVMKGMIYREIHVLQSLCGHKNIIKLLHVVPHALTVDPALVFEYVENIEFQALLPTLSPEETQFYMHEIISGVAYAHAMGIVHMDIKPANIMIHNATRTLKIIDWGLSFYYVPGRLFHLCLLTGLLS